METSSSLCGPHTGIRDFEVVLQVDAVLTNSNMKQTKEHELREATCIYSCVE